MQLVKPAARPTPTVLCKLNIYFIVFFHFLACVCNLTFEDLIPRPRPGNTKPFLLRAIVVVHNTKKNSAR